jgi:Fic family protein
LPSELAAGAEDASNELARFDAELGSEIAPFSAVLLRTESAASSKIENLSASALSIAEAELLHEGRPNASLIVSNTRAMTAAIALADRIDARAILTMHAELLNASAPEIAGRWRDEQVWIGGNDLGPHRAVFVPPHDRHVATAIDDLVAYIERDDVPVLVHAAIAHAQFETIHPFPDGNGRTGRALLHAHLRNKHLTRNVTVPISAGLLANTDAYFDALTRFRAGDPFTIVEQITGASFAAVTNGRRLVDDLRAIRAEWEETVNARRRTNSWRIADLVVRHPVVNAAFIAEQLSIRQANVYGPIEPLIEAGVLSEFTDRRRNRMWRAPHRLGTRLRITIWVRLGFRLTAERLIVVKQLRAA